LLGGKLLLMRNLFDGTKFFCEILLLDKVK
jgi:hypothetical protein